MDITSLVNWFKQPSSLSELQSIFQLGVGLNLVVLGYAERRISLEEKIEAEIDNNIEALNRLHRHFDTIIDEPDQTLRKKNRSEIDSAIHKKWDIIQIGIISTRINNNYYRLRHYFQRSDGIDRALMFIIALLCCVALFVSSLAPSHTIPNWLSLLLGLVAILPAFVRFYRASKQATMYRKFMIGDRAPPSSGKLRERQERVNRTIEDEKVLFAKRLKRSPDGLKPDERFVSVAQETHPTALYFISGQINARIKTLGSKI